MVSPAECNEWMRVRSDQHKDTTKPVSFDQYCQNDLHEVQLQIPRPFLTIHVDNLQLEQQSAATDSLNIYDLSSERTDTPTRFTLLGQSGVVHSSSPTTCQLTFTVCTLALVALVGMIVYMEVYLRQYQV